MSHSLSKGAPWCAPTKHPERAGRLRPAYAALAGVAASLLFASPALALKPFTLVEDGYPEGQGTRELESTLEVVWHPQTEHSFKEWSLEEELEYGFNNQLDLRVKGSVVYTDSADSRGLHLGDGGVEVQYYFTNPTTDALGVSVIASALFGERGGFATEEFLVLQKDFGKWIVAYNLGAVTEVEHFYSGGDHNTTGTIVNAGAIEYVPQPWLRVGVEASVESGFEEWSRGTGSVMYAGPVLNVTPTDNLWISVGLDYQVTGKKDEPLYRFGLVVGYYF